MDCVSRKFFYSMSKNNVDDTDVVYKSIHMNLERDGKNVDHELAKGAYELLQNIKQLGSIKKFDNNHEGMHLVSYVA
jgi:hypothetical protein